MANQYVNKLVLGTDVIFDLTSDTITADKILSGYTAHDKSGAPITGTCNFDSNTQDDTAAVGEILVGKTAHARGTKLTGTMPNNGAASGSISTKTQQYTIPMGFHDGSGKVGISTTEQNKIIAENIKSGVQILGVTGTYGGEAIRATTGSATPTLTSQTVLPPSGYDYFSQFTVAAIPYTYSDNAAGGKTLTVGG